MTVYELIEKLQALKLDKNTIVVVPKNDENLGPVTSVYEYMMVRTETGDLVEPPLADGTPTLVIVLG